MARAPSQNQSSQNSSGTAPLSAPPAASILSIWPTLNEESRRGFQEDWTLELVDPKTQRSLWIQMTLLSSTNGFRRECQVWAVASHRGENREVSKLAIRQSHDLGGLKLVGNSEGSFALTMGECSLDAGSCQGAVTAKGRTIRWDLKLDQSKSLSWSFVPETLSKTGLLDSRWASPLADLKVSGTTEVDGEKQEWSLAPGTVTHRSVGREWHSWARGHCNTFKTDLGEPIEFAFQGLSASIQLPGELRGPSIQSFVFIHRGQPFVFNSIWDSLRNRSRFSQTEWEFEVEKGDYRFRGQMQSEHRDFAGLSSEDLDGSVYYLANSKLSNLKILVYRRGKLEQSVVSSGLASFEVCSREKNPYVPLLI